MASNVNETQAPFNAVGQVGEVLGGVAGHGSGVFIAPDEFLTAAHLVWQQGVGVASDVFVDPALNLPNFYGQFRPINYHYFSIADSSSSAAVSQSDFALLHFAQPLSGFGTMKPIAGFAGGTVNITGYPDSAGTNFMVNQIETVSLDGSTSTLTNQFNPGSGTSGGPVWIGSGGSAQVVGVGSTTTSAAAISAPVLTLINQWIAADHAGSSPSGAIAVDVPKLFRAITPDPGAPGVDVREAALVDMASYKAARPDVAAAGIDPAAHFAAFGWHEGMAPDPLFDVSYYLAHNPDVAAIGMDPLLHYAAFGWKEGRDPSASFSTSHYLAVNADVKSVGMNPLQHYLDFGVTEGRGL